MQRLVVLFFGHVQGVGFRRETQKKALELKIYGSIENGLDGSVKAIIEGNSEAIFTLIQQLTTSFSLTKIEMIFEPRTEKLQDFSILR